MYIVGIAYLAGGLLRYSICGEARLCHISVGLRCLAGISFL